MPLRPTVLFHPPTLLSETSREARLETLSSL
jgi:hypothetical protein